MCALVWIFSLFNIQCEWRTTSCPVIFRPFSVSAQYIFTNKNTKRWCIFVKPLSSILHCFPPGRLKADFFNKFWSQTYKQNRMSCSKTISEWSSLKKSFPSLPPSSWGQRHMTWAVVSLWATWLPVSSLHTWIAWKCYANSTPLTFVFFFSILDLIVQIVIIHGHIYFVIIIFWAQAVTVMTKSPHGPALLQAACTKFKENKGKKNISLRLSTRTDYGGSSDYSEGNLRCKTLIF